MAFFETAQFVEAWRTRGEDRLDVIHDDDRTILVAADGAGGIGNGDLAAETIVREVRSAYAAIETAEQWEAELRQIDFRIGAGESTAVVVDLRPKGIVGASVGDSAAWIVEGGRIADLTRAQIRKPLLGSQQACAVGFSRGPLTGVLLVGTDGFFNYVKRDDLPPAIARADFFSLPRLAVEMVRLPSGELWDDVALLACRIRPRRHVRKRYAI